jgi:uncharacterized membrane protein required for colicin V production
MELLKSLDWVDILVAVLAVKMLFTSFKTGFVTEFMKTLGLFIALVVAFHYYSKVALMLGGSVALTLPILQVIVFAGIWLVIVTAMKYIREGLFLVFTVQTISLVDRWGAAVVSVGRFFLTAGMLLFIFLLTDDPYMERMTRSSLSQAYVLPAATEAYKRTFEAIVVKFYPGKKMNPAVLQELSETGKK